MIDDSKPNGYRVFYSVLEGDNYAGGWATHSRDITSLDELLNIKDIEKVVPIFKHVNDEFKPLTELEIIEARDIAKHKQNKRNNLAEIQRAKQRLKELEKQANELT